MMRLLRIAAAVAAVVWSLPSDAEVFDRNSPGTFDVVRGTVTGIADLTVQTPATMSVVATPTSRDTVLKIDNVPVLTMHQGACLTGPLEVLDRDGSPLFKLKAGIDYPAGCRK